MSLVTLVSGGVDSTLMAMLAHREGVKQFPLFVDYGQLCVEREWSACSLLFPRLGLPKPRRVNLSGYGQLIPSGITNRSLRINEDAFLPGRNLLLVVVGAAYAYSMKARSVALGLLNEDDSIFPDQTVHFLDSAQRSVSLALGFEVSILAPLMPMTKRDVLLLAEEAGICGTYSCHAGLQEPCGVCVSCVERTKSS